MTANPSVANALSELLADSKSLGAAIRVFRVKRRLSQSALCDLCFSDSKVDIDQSTLSRVENGTIAISRDKLMAILGSLECTASEIEQLVRELRSLDRVLPESSGNVKSRQQSTSAASRARTRSIANDFALVQSYLQESIDASHTGLWVFDVSHNNIWMSSTLLSMLPSRFRNFVTPNSDLLDVVHPDDHSLVGSVIAGCLKGKSDIVECKCRLRCDHGKWLPVRIVGSVQRDFAHRCVKIAGAIVVVTDVELFACHAIDAMAGFVFAKDTNLRFTFVNRALAEAFGRKVEDIIGRTDAELNTNESEVRFFVETDTNLLASSGRLAIDEEVLTDVFGKKHYLATIKERITLPNNEVQLLGVAVDITQRREVQATVEQLLEATSEAVWCADLEGKIVRANQAMLSAIGAATSVTVIGKKYEEVFDHKVAVELRAADFEVIDSQRTVKDRLKHGVFANGTSRWFVVSRFLWRSLSGQIQGIIGVARDVSELMFLRRCDQMNSRALDLVINRMRRCAYVKDDSGVYMKANEAFANMFRLSYREVCGKRDNELFPACEFGRIQSEDMRVIRGGLGAETKIDRVCFRDDCVRDVMVTRKPLLDSNDVVIGLLCVMRIVGDDGHLGIDVRDEIHELQSDMSEIGQILDDRHLRMAL